MAERDGTSIALSFDLPLETLPGIAASLVPAPTEPPELQDVSV